MPAKKKTNDAALADPPPPADAGVPTFTLRADSREHFQALVTLYHAVTAAERAALDPILHQFAQYWTEHR